MMDSTCAGGTLRILLVEDDPDGSELIQCVLELHGDTCHVAHRGRDALALASDTTIDVAVIDLALPDTTGYDVARALRTSRGPAIYLAALSGYGGASHRARALEAGFDCYLTKPAPMSAFAEILERVRRGSGTPIEQAAPLRVA